MEDSFPRNKAQNRDTQSTSKRAIKRPITPISPERSQENKRFPSFILFLSVIILVNLCPFETDQHLGEERSIITGEQLAALAPTIKFGHHLERCLVFVKLMFTNPMRLNKRATRYTLAEAKVLGKMAKVWYIKKKIKKFGKKLKKHTIAVPVLTAIPIYEQSYYPQHPHIPQIHHQALQHAAAASVYVPTIAQIAQTPSPINTSNSNGQQALATAASNTHHQLANYRVPPHHQAQHHQQHHHPAIYHPMPAASAHHIINSYAPSPPLYVDDTGALYGTYGNAYGRYDGGYQYW